MGKQRSALSGLALRMLTPAGSIRAARSNCFMNPVWLEVLRKPGGCFPKKWVPFISNPTSTTRRAPISIARLTAWKPELLP